MKKILHTQTLAPLILKPFENSFLGYNLNDLHDSRNTVAASAAPR